MGSWRRRDILRSGVAAGLVVAGCGNEPSEPTKPAEPSEPPPTEPPCDEVVASLLEASDPFVPLVEWLAQGVEPDRLYAAALEAGARLLPPEGDLHTVLGVGAARVLGGQVTGESPLMPLFRTWYEQNALAWLTQTAEEPALPELGAAPSGDAAAALVAAWEVWDEDAADAAIVALYREGGRDAVVGPLTRYGQRNHDWLGHTAIWTGHALRTLDGFGWGCAEPVVRSLARAIAANEAKSSTAAFHANLDRIGEVPPGWRDGADDQARVPELMSALRFGDADTCASTVLEALADGVSPRTLWTALGIVAVELTVRWQHESWGVHELDAINAFRHLQQLTPDPDTEVLALLQAAAWRPEFQAFVEGASPVVDETLDVLTPAAGSAPDLDTVLELTGGNAVDAARSLVAFFAAGGDPEALMAAWPDVIVKHAGQDVHHLKYHAAIVEEAKAALPEWRSTLLLGITMRNPSPNDPPWIRYDDARELIAALE